MNAGRPKPPVLIKVLNTIEGTWNHLDHQWDRYDGSPAPGSAAAAEIDGESEWASEWSERPLYDTCGVASASILAAADQLRGLRRTTDVPPLAWASQALARACAEQSARSWWLVEPDIGMRKRVARFATEQLSSLWEADRAGMRMRSGRDPQQLLAEIKYWAVANRYKIVKGPNGRPCVDKPRLTTTTLLEKMLPGVGRDMYAALSPVAHGTVGGVLSVVSGGPTDGDVGRVKVDLDAVLITTSCALVAFFRAFGRLVEWFGWDRASWESWETHARGAMGSLWNLAERLREREAAAGIRAQPGEAQ